jgi:hypothetical protein
VPILNYSNLSLSELAAIDVANLPIEDLAEYSKALSATAKVVSKQATDSKDAIKIANAANIATDTDGIKAAIVAMIPSLVANYSNKVKASFTLEVVDGEINLADFNLGSSVRVGGVAASFSNGVKFTIDGNTHYTFNAESNLNFGEFAIDENVELTNGKRVLLALGISVKAKAESAEASSTSKLRKLEDSVKARVGVVLADGSIATLDELLTASD